MNIIEENLILLKQKENNFFGIKKGFEFLDLFLDQCNNLEQNNENGCVIVFDYRTKKKKSFEKKKLQSMYSNLYSDFLLENYFLNFLSYSNFRKCIFQILRNFEFNDDKKEFEFMKIFAWNLMHCIYLLQDNKFSKDFILLKFSERFHFMLNKEDSIQLGELIISVFLANEILSVCDDSNDLKLSDDYFFFHLKFMSFNVVKIYPDNFYDISYNCIYGFNNLINVIVNFFNLRNTATIEKLVSKTELKTEKDFILYCCNNYIDLDIYAQELKSFDKESKSLNMKIALDRIIINSHCFHTIAALCFEKHYFNDKSNILLDKTPNFKLNFYPY